MFAKSAGDWWYGLHPTYHVKLADNDERWDVGARCVSKVAILRKDQQRVMRARTTA